MPSKKKQLFRIITVFIFLSLSLVFSSCKKEGTCISAIGTIEKQEPGLMNQGTHVLVGEKPFLALKSKKINLDHFMNKPVIIFGELTEGQSVNDGIRLVEVLSIQD